MTIIDGLIILFGIIAAYFIIVFTLKFKGYFEKLNISFYGPALLIRTTRGKGLLKKLAKRKKFWKNYANLGIIIIIIIMIVMVSLFVWQAWSYTILTPEQQADFKEQMPGIEAALILPGINPILPFEYIFFVIVALAIGIVIHEFSHGILTIITKVKVKSLGLLYFIIPIGAFVEPDEEKLKKVSELKRMRVFAAGPTSNIIAAMILLLVFSFVLAPAIQPIEGAMLISTEQGSALEEKLQPGMVITSINDTDIKSTDALFEEIINIPPNQEVNLTYYYDGEYNYDTVELLSISEVTKNESHRNISYFNAVFLRDEFKNDMYNIVKNPLHDFPKGALLLYSLPFIGYLSGYNPIADPFTGGVEITGPLGALPPEVYWFLITLFFWVFWLNLLLGVFNALPIIPFDGGFILKDFLKLITKKFRSGISDEKAEKIVGNITLIITFIVLILVFFPFIVKYI
jgi:membrane-associated protease RseP (regulator of RpoE activity)